MNRLGLILSACSLIALPCFGQETLPLLSTDRPTVGTGPDVVQAHSTVIETGVGFVTGAGTSNLDGMETFVRVGLGRGVEVRAYLPDRDRSRSALHTLWQDTSIGTKIALPSLQTWHFASGFSLSIPTGSKGTSSGTFDPYALFSVSHSSHGHLSGFGSASLGLVGDGTGIRNRVLQLACDLDWAAPHRLTPFVEWAPAISSARDSNTQIMQGGTTWLLRPNMQFDVRSGMQITSSTISLLLGSGVSMLLTRPMIR